MAVCHATTVLLEAKKSDGELLVSGKFWTGFADAEEEFADQAVGQKIQPYRIETEAKKLTGTTFKVAAPFSSYAIQDGNLITGQQQNSGAAAAELVVELLEIFVPEFDVSVVGSEPFVTGSSCFAVSTMHGVAVFAAPQWNLLVLLKLYR